MTEKQENILKAALSLFAAEGYHATSTSAIAKRAGVSEALIFRHFKNKEGLLQAILEAGERKVKSLYADIVMEPDPRKVIQKTLELPFSVPETEYEFWRLQFKIKWEIQYQHAAKMEPLKMVLRHAFAKLGYPSPDLEAEYLVYYLDGISGAILRGELSNPQEIQAFLLAKYNH